MTRRLWLATSIVCFTAMAQEATPPPAAPAPRAAGGGAALAVINDRTITVEEFNKRYKQNSELVPGRAPDKKEVLKNVIYFELATQEARRLGLHKEPALKDQFDILLYQAIVRSYVQPKVDKITPAEAEIKQYYEASPLLRTSHIVLLSRPDMTPKELDDLKKKAAEIRKNAIEKTSSFEDLARKYSEGPNAKNGGDVDWGARHKLLPEYYDAALGLKSIGDISEVVTTPYGLHIIKLTGRKPYSEMDQIYRDFIVRSLREQKGQSIFTEYFEGLRKKYAVRVNEKLLD